MAVNTYSDQVIDISITAKRYVIKIMCCFDQCQNVYIKLRQKPPNSQWEKPYYRALVDVRSKFKGYYII